MLLQQCHLQAGALSDDLKCQSELLLCFWCHWAIQTLAYLCCSPNVLRESQDQMSSNIPLLFRCPISLDLFTDPVTLSTGQTYDRPSIERWLAGGNPTCPVTMQRLHDTSLVPNRTLRHLIDQWLLSGADADYSRINRPDSGTASSLASLKRTLQSPETAAATRLEMLKKVRILSSESDTGHACLIKLGYFPLLLQILFDRPILADFETTGVVLDCVLGLSDSAQLDALNAIKQEPSLASFLLLFDRGNVKIRTRLCDLLEKIATNDSTRELCLILGQSRRVLQVVVSLLHSRADGRAAAEAAVRAISGICSAEANRDNAVREGAVEGLVSYLMNSTGKNGSVALATLEVLAGLDAGKMALIKNPNAVRLMVKSVFRFSSSDNQGSEHAVGVLTVVCCESAKARAEAVSAGVLTQVLLLLQSQCGSKAKAKARALLKLLSSMWDSDPSVSVGANFYHVL